MARAVHRYTSAATVNATLFRAGATRLVGYNIINTGAAARYVKLYNRSSAPSNADTPILTIQVPAGADVEELLGDAGIRFEAGLGYRIVAGVADADNTAIGAGEVLMQLIWENAVGT